MNFEGDARLLVRSVILILALVWVVIGARTRGGWLWSQVVAAQGAQTQGSPTQTADTRPSLLKTPVPGAAPVYGYTVVRRYPHLNSSYTEGFFYLDGLFYEGTGREGQSEVLAIQPETGKVLRRVKLADELFGEGIVDWGPNIYEWTWTTHLCFVYDRATFRLVNKLMYDGEGWGMTRTATEIVTSDGSANLTFRDPKTFEKVRSITVHEGLAVIEKLNELEFIHGEIWANIWHSDRIVRISPDDGRVIAWIDLSGILPESQKVDGESVLNGIAYDAKKDRIFVTGKQWPIVFQIKVEEK